MNSISLGILLVQNCFWLPVIVVIGFVIITIKEEKQRKDEKTKIENALKFKNRNRVTYF